MGLNIFLEDNYTDNLSPILTYDTFTEAKVQLDIDSKCCIPSNSSPVQLNFIVGLTGIVGNGKAGIKLQFCLMEGKYYLDLYFQLNDFEFKFYLIQKKLMNYEEEEVELLRILFNGTIIPSNNTSKEQNISTNILLRTIGN